MYFSAQGPIVLSITQLATLAPIGTTPFLSSFGSFIGFVFGPLPLPPPLPLLPVLVVVGIIAGLFAVGAWILKKMKFWANGGPASGLGVVGEKGPKLVNMPAGSRVYSNAQTRSMGGNTIHVHVNGRVGASDAEIRDIADKVARHINLRMNRTGTTGTGF